MAIEKKEWKYYDQVAGQYTREYITRDELDALRRDGAIDDYTYVINKNMIRPGGSQGVPYSSLVSFDLTFRPEVAEFYEKRANAPLTILSGPNNSGKTLLLKGVFSLVGRGGYLVGCNRFFHVDVLNTRSQSADQYYGLYDNFVQSYYTAQQNTEDSPFNLEQAITGLKNAQLEVLCQLATDLLGSKVSIEPQDRERKFSPFVVQIGTSPIRRASTGTRLLITLLGIALNDRFKVLLVDEPEIGLSPKVQMQLARMLYDQKLRERYWPHLRLFIATHSHLFLDRAVLSNNYIVTKRDKTVTVQQVEGAAGFHQLQFNMLGNELESLFLPSAILIVEGPSDTAYLTAIVRLHLTNRTVAIVKAHGEGGIEDKLNVLRETFGGLEASPYRTRLLVVLDRKHSVSTQRLTRLGVLPENIVQWTKNGIEYYYPARVVAEEFHCDVKEVSKINFEREPIEWNDIRRSKRQLADAVANCLTVSDALDPEVAMMLDRLRTASMPGGDGAQMDASGTDLGSDTTART